MHACECTDQTGLCEHMPCECSCHALSGQIALNFEVLHIERV
jgi:hypothetical protein